MNSLVEEYRKLIPNDERTDDELTLLLGQQNAVDHRYDDKPDFLADYQRLSAPSTATGTNSPDSIPVAQEMRSQWNRSVSSLGSTALGATALAAHYVGAKETAANLAAKARDMEAETAADNPVTADRLEDVKDLGTAARYVVGKAVSFVPQVAEAVALGAAGAAAGSAVGPEGAAAGGAGGLLEGFLARKAAKGLLATIVKQTVKEDLEKYGLDLATKKVAEDQLRKLAAGEAVDGLLPQLLNGEGKGWLAVQAKSVAKSYGAKSADLINFFALGAGGAYPRLENRPGVTDTDAATAALIAGVGSAAGAILPNSVVEKLFQGVQSQAGESTAKLLTRQGFTDYLKRTVQNAAQHLPAGVVAGGAMELGNIAADRYVDPTKRDQPLDDEELSRILNASVVMGGAGAVMAPITALAHGRAPKVSRSPSGKDVTKMTPAEIIEEHRNVAEGKTPEGEPVVKSSLDKNPSEVAASSPEATASTPAEGGAVASVAAQPPPGPTPEEIAAQKAQADALLEKKRRASQVVTGKTDLATQAVVDAARAKTHTAPTPEQAIAGNYPKGKVLGSAVGLPGMDISIETPKGTERHGIGPGGQPWAVQMPGDYGYFLGTKGKDKDHVDVTIGPNPNAGTVYVVDQIDPKTGKFDEHKTFLGFESQVQAEHAYDASFSDGSGPTRRGAITAMDKSAFKDWLKNEQATKKAVKYEEPKPEPVESPTTAQEYRDLRGKISAQHEKGLTEARGRGDGKAYDQLREYFRKLDLPQTGKFSRDYFTSLFYKAVPTSEAWNGGIHELTEATLPKKSASVIRDEKIERIADLKKILKGAEKDSPGAVEMIAGIKKEMAQLESETKGIEHAKPIESADAVNARSSQPELPVQDVKPAAVESGEGVRSGGQGKEPEKPAGASESAPVKVEPVKAESPAPAPPVEPEPVKPKAVLPDQADVESAGTVDTSGRGRRGKGKETVEPAYFEPTGKEEFPDLSKRVLSESAPAGNERNSMTRRTVSILDHQTGQVHVVSVFENNKETKVSRFTPDVKTTPNAKSLPLRRVLVATMEDGKPRFEVIGSTKTKGLTEYAHDVYSDRNAYESEFAGPVRRAQSEVQAKAAAMEATLQVSGKKKGGRQTSSEAEAQTEEPTATHEEAPVEEEAPGGGEQATDTERVRPDRINLEPGEVAALVKKLPKIDDVEDFYNAVMAHDFDPDLTMVVGKIVRQDPGFFRDVAEHGLGKTLEDYGYKTTEADKADAGKAGPVESSAAGKAKDTVSDAELRRLAGTGGPEADVGVGQDNLGPATPDVEAQGGPRGEAGGAKPGDAGQQVAGWTREKAARLAQIREWEEELDSGGRIGVEPGRWKQILAEKARLESEEPGQQGLKFNLPQPSEDAIIAHRKLSEVEVEAATAAHDLLHYIRSDFTSEEMGKAASVREGLTNKSELADFMRETFDEIKKRILHRVSKIKGGSNGYDPEGGRAAVEDVKASVITAVEANPYDPSTPFDNGIRLLGAVKKAANTTAEKYKAPRYNRLPEPTTEGTPEDRALLDTIHKAASRAGIDTRLIRGDKAMGIASPKDRAFAQVIGDTVGSQDVRTAFHEVGHLAFADEAPEMRSRILHAVDRLSDEALGVDTSADTRIRSSDPAGLGKEAVNEERLVEATASKLQREGFNPDEAKGFAKQFVRTLKDHYLRAAMKVQEWLGFKPNPELARRYFENRVRSLLAGDRLGQSYVDFIGARPLTSSERRRTFFTSVRHTAENFDHRGIPSHEHVSDYGAGGTAFNRDAMREGWKFTTPLPADKLTRTTDVERRVAPLNHLADLVDRAAASLMEREDMARIINKTKSKSPTEFLHKLLGIDDPKAKRDLYKNELEPDGSPVSFDMEKRLKDFKAKENRDEVLLRSFRNVDDMMTEMDSHRRDAEREKADIEQQQRKGQDALEEKAQTLKDFEEIKADPTKVIPGIEDHIKEAKDELDEAKAGMKSLGKQIERQKKRLAILETISPTIQIEHQRLAAQLEIRPDFVFRPDAWFNSPTKADVATKDLTKHENRAQLKLNPDGRTVTSQKDLMEHLRRMRAFLDHRETLASTGDENALDVGYHTVKQQRHEILARTVAGADISLDVKPTGRPGFITSMLADGKRLVEGIGSRAARSFMRRQNDYETILASEHNYNETMGRKTGQMEDALLALIPNAGDRDWLRTNILTPVKDALKGMHDLSETYAADPAALKRAQYARLKENLLRYPTTNAHVRPVVERFMPLLQKLIDHQWEMDQHRVAEAEKSGLGVEDTRLGKLSSLASGEKVPTTRRRVAVGSYTFSRKIGRTFSGMVKSLRKSGWSNLGAMLKGGEGESSRLEEALLDSDDAARSVMNELGFNDAEHGDMVANKFFRALVETPGTFDGPRAEGKPGEKGQRIPADMENVKAAFEASGAHDPIGFASALHELSGGAGNRTQFILDTIAKLGQRFKEADGMYRRFEPSDVAESQAAIRGMVPDALIDARTVEHLPAKWFDYHDYDRRESAMMAQRIAANRAFGRNAEGLAVDADEMAKEVMRAKDRMTRAVEAAKEEKPKATAKEIDQMVQAKLGKDYETVTRLAKRDNLVESVVRNQSTYFRKEHSDDLTMQWAARVTHTLGQLLVNRPTSAINQLEQLFGINLRYGAGGSTITGTGSALREFGSEVTKSLAQAIGVQMQDRSWVDQMWNRMRLTDPGVVRRIGDVMIRQSGETGLGQVLRGISEAPGVTMNRLGEKATHTAFTPLQPFNFVATASEVAVTKALWRMVGAHIANGRKFLADHRELLSDPNTVLDSKTMGLTGRDKYTFDRLTSDLRNYNLDYTNLVREMMERGDNTPFSDEAARRLYSMSLHEILGESSLTTMPSASYTDTIYRVISPLLGWAFRRGVAVLDAGRTPEGKRDLVSMANGLAGLAILAGGGLGTSALVNAYSEDALGKKRNLRSMTGPTATQAIVGMWENLNRVGSFGLLGEGVNMFANVGTGEDNRALDANRRIVALSAINSLSSAVSSFVNQGNEADYVHVIRPMIESVGGGGALQYLQLANHTLGFDNPEARATARMNAQNWLKAGGRELQMEVRPSTGGYNAPTPMSPSLTRMELAAYANDSGDFHAAYLEAIEAAKASGYDADPVEHVKRAFGARNPLRTVFAATPTQADYQRILGALPDSGQRDVSEAVNLFNIYAEKIGATAFEGKKEKATPAALGLKKMTLSPTEARLRGSSPVFSKQ